MATMTQQPIIPSTPTMEALFRAKEWVATALASKGTARLLMQIWSPMPTRGMDHNPTFVDEASSDENGPASTTTKLLILKHRQTKTDHLPDRSRK
jgi:hypothetical protein